MITMVFLMSLLGINAVASEANPLTLPFTESFGGEEIEGSWIKKASNGSSLKFTDGWLAVDWYENSHAHIERTLDVDNVTITAKLFSCSSIYLVFDENNWCGVGRVSPTPFPKFYSTITVDGTTTEKDHRGCNNAGNPPFVRIQLGKNCIRFQYSYDSDKWETLRVVERPAHLTQTPSLVAYGKHYAPGTKPFADAADAVISSEPGAKYYGSVTAVSIDKTPQKDLLMTAEERKNMGRIEVYETTDILLRGKDEPTFDSVARIYPEMKYPREAVGVPEHPLDIGVDYLGRLDVSPWSQTPVAWFEIGDPAVTLGSETHKFSRRLLDGYIPILTLSRRQEKTQYEMTVFGCSEGMKPDKDLYAYIHIRASGSKTDVLPQELSLVYEGGGKRSSFSMQGEGQNATGTFLKFKYPNPASAEQVTAKEFADKKEETASCWRGRIEEAAVFEIPDKRVNEAYRAWIAYWLINADKVNGFTELHDGTGFYDIVFGYSMSLFNMALEMYGLHNLAEHCLDTQLNFQQADGLYVQECGLPDHGSLLLALGAHYAMTKDKEWVRRTAPQITKGCDWVLRQRESAPKEGLTKGLIKFRPYNDYPQPVFNYLGNSYCCVGLEICSDALRDIGMTTEANRYAYEAGKYRQDILDSMELAVFKDGDMEILPIEPDTHRLLKLSKYQGGFYYGLVASSMLENDFLPPDDKRTSLLIDMLEKRQGLVTGVCDFAEGIDHAYTYGYLMTQMKRGDIRKVLLGFWSMLAYGMTRDTYSPVEVTMIATGENQLTLPHSYSCTQQLRLLRNMLLREDGNTLIIGDAVPGDWLKPGKRIAIKAAPTSFGPVSCRISSNADGSIHIHLEPPTRNIPEEIRIKIRHPQSLPISEVDCIPSTPLLFSSDTVVIKRQSKPIDVTVKVGGK